jgi:hypothetical protein
MRQNPTFGKVGFCPMAEDTQIIRYEARAFGASERARPMASAITILSRLVVAGLLIVTPARLAFAQDDRVEALKEWYSLADKRTDFEVSDPTLLPSRLALAAQNSGCRYKDEIERNPVRFMKIESSRLAIVYCSSVASGSHQVFDLSNLQRPRLIEFPILAQPEGFGTTLWPGVISWNKESGEFQAWRGSDQLPTLAIRHTYRFSTGFGSPAFIVVHVEVQQIPGPNEWTTIWDAPRWSFPPLTERPFTPPWQQK